MRARVHWALTGTAGLFAVTLSLCYWQQPDSLAAVTILPAWLWAILGFAFLAAGWRRTTCGAGSLVLLLWLCYLGLFAEEGRSVSRLLLPQRTAPTAVRIVSLNCNGNRDAAFEVVAYRPDIVLLQESPRRSEVEELGQRLYGREAVVAWGPDASAIGRGPGLVLPPPASFNAARIHLRLLGGLEMDVLSVRLAPHLVWANFWSPAAWADVRATRRRHAEQVRALAGLVSDHYPAIIGGDFNQPAGDAPLRRLSMNLRDAFGDAGRGWGDTFPNDCPCWRIDQIWVDTRFEPLMVRAARTKNSDHRLVFCELSVPR